jgi:hypothetical protein
MPRLTKEQVEAEIATLDGLSLRRSGSAGEPSMATRRLGRSVRGPRKERASFDGSRMRTRNWLELSVSSRPRQRNRKPERGVVPPLVRRLTWDFQRGAAHERGKARGQEPIRALQASGP